MMTSHREETIPIASELRAQRARLQMPLYQLAPRVGLHPARLGRMLNERERLPPRLARRLAKVLGLLGVGGTAA